jgi:CRP-like cAMP-binding protein
MTPAANPASSSGNAPTTSESKYWYFKNFFFFDMIEDEAYRQLEVRSEFLKCEKDAFVYLPGESDDTVYFLKKGYIKLGAYDDGGREVILNVLQPGDIFGSISRPQGLPTKEFAQAMSDVSVCHINVQRFQDLLAQRSDLSVQVIKTVGERMNKMERKLISLAFRDARTRVIEFLREFAADYGRVRGTEIHIDNFLTHQDMANLTATSRQLVSTLLNELKEAGQIDYDRKHITVKVPPQQLK